MIRVLLVEDEAQKRQAICKALSDVPEFDISWVETASDVHAARKCLASTAFDLLILDIALPLRPDGKPEPDAGLHLLAELSARPHALKIPAHIVGMTAHAELFARAQQPFSSRLLTLVHFDASTSDWAHALQARLRHILHAGEARDASAEYGSDLVICCALYSPELSAVLRLPWGWTQVQLPHDHTLYWKGSFDAGGSKRTVYAAHASRMGMPAAAVLSMKMIAAFRPRLIAMTGIAAGVAGRVQMGGVVVADASWDWGSGKWIVSKGNSLFLPAPRQVPLAPELRPIVRDFAQDRARVAAALAEWPGQLPERPFEVHLGPIASGASVLADKRTAKKVLEQHRELLAIDMEAYAVFACAEESCHPRPTAFVAKAIVDFADGEKDDRWQQFGAYASAAVMREIVGKWFETASR